MLERVRLVRDSPKLSVKTGKELMILEKEQFSIFRLIILVE